jgi:peptide/nickel transport system permease protein
MHYLLYTGDHGHFLNVLPGDPARMMLDQNENSEQLALRRSMVLTNPLLPSIYTISTTSPLSLHSKKRVRLHVFERGKIQCSTLIQFLISSH